ncbi:conserved phage C-terminal domain-containing protein [Paenibacillus sp. GYB004]|uniref:conserved phage C-terminal domain-containing protein n=1 Tax=Paenibacillus sp. GYB004 TaxID=2994393 RepID=UPI002F96A550
MARPTKEGLEYFPLDVDIDQDDKLVVPISKFGMQGFGIIIRLMMEIYKNGYFLNWSEKEQHSFSIKTRESIETLEAVVNELMNWGFLHKGKFESHRILTSKGFQKRYLLATGRRKGVEVHQDYSLLEVETPKQDGVIANNNPDQLELLPTETTQKKVKEKKVKEKNIYVEIIDYLNEKTGKRYSPASQSNRSLINGRVSEGRTLDDFIQVIDTKCSHWLEDPKMVEYLRPDTLFRPSNFDKYLNQQPKIETTKDPFIDSRDKEVAFQQWIQEGNDPDEFDWS